MRHCSIWKQTNGHCCPGEKECASPACPEWGPDGLSRPEKIWLGLLIFLAFLSIMKLGASVLA